MQITKDNLRNMILQEAGATEFKNILIKLGLQHDEELNSAVGSLEQATMTPTDIANGSSAAGDHIMDALSILLTNNDEEDHNSTVTDVTPIISGEHEQSLDESTLMTAGQLRQLIRKAVIQANNADIK